MINKVIIVGNVGADPEVRTLESGVKVARLRVATTERMYNREKQEATEHTEWHSVTLWRNLADVADKYIRKGSQVYIEGRLRNRDWTDAQGVKRYAVEILADDLKMLGRKSDNTASGGGYASGGQTQQSPGQYGGSSYGAPQQTPSANNYNDNSTIAPPVDEDTDDLPF